MPKTILLATTNATKLKNFLLGFKNVPNITFKTLKDFPEIPDCEEHGNTYEEIALQKCKYFAKASGLPTIADDSGVFISAFPDQFGINSHSQFGEEAFKSDMVWLREFIDLMEDVEDRKAALQSVVCYYDPETDTKHYAHGELAGEVEEFPQAPIQKGGPIQTVFTPTGADDVLVNMPEKWHLEHNHRHKAIAHMRDFLETL